MTRVLAIVAIEIVVLAAAAAVGAPARWDVASSLFLAFGLINAAAVLRGTEWVRGLTVVAVASALAWPEGPGRGLIGILIWLAWPPLFFGAWALSREARTGVVDVPLDARTGARARASVAALIAAVALASFAFRILTAGGLQQTAALFVGIPALLAITVVLFSRPRTAVGVACKAVTVGLLVALVFLGEGVLCVAMSAPLFYFVAVLVGYAMDRTRGTEQPTHRTMYGLAVLALLPMSLEGVSDRLSLPRDETVSETRVVRASAEDVHRALFETPRFDRVLPPYLRAGFPRPVATRIETTADARRWIVDIRGGETRLTGQEPAPGRLALDLVEDRPGRITWRAVSDNSHVTHFLRWRDATVEWQAIDARTTRVTWTLRYRRGLDPVWYFGPLERHAVRLAARYLIETVATP